MLHKPTRRAFTLMELLIAVALTGLMLFLINQIFNETRQAVSRGITINDILSNSRAVASQAGYDAKAMKGPVDIPSGAGPGGVYEGGIIVILPKMLWTDIETGDDVVGQRWVRADQLSFITSRQPNQNPIAPEGGTFSPPDDGGLARYLRVWYGHAVRTNPDGSYDADLSYPVYNQYANRWVLGRQALFLGEKDTAAPTWAHAEGARYDAMLQSPYGAGVRLFNGLADYAYVSLADPSHPEGSIVSAAESGDSLGADMAAGDYRDKAVALYTFGAARLQVNPEPLGVNLTIPQVAHMHGLLMENVSDFAVDFAADISPLDGAVDVITTGTDPGEIKWYGYWYNNPDEDRRDPDNPTGTMPYDPDLATVYDVPTGYVAFESSPGVPGADAALVWRHDDTAFKHTTGVDQQSNWPYLLRLRWRQHDSAGNFYSGNGVHGLWYEQILSVPRPVAKP